MRKIKKLKIIKCKQNVKRIHCRKNPDPLLCVILKISKYNI